MAHHFPNEHKTVFQKVYILNIRRETERNLCHWVLLAPWKNVRNKTAKIPRERISKIGKDGRFWNPIQDKVSTNLLSRFRKFISNRLEIFFRRLGITPLLFVIYLLTFEGRTCFLSRYLFWMREKMPIVFCQDIYFVLHFYCLC